MALEAVEFDAPIIVGHSLGGMLATHAVANGQSCSAVVNVDGWAGEPLPPRLSDEQAIAATEAMAMMQQFPAEVLDQIIAMQSAQAVLDGLDTAVLEAVLRRQFAIDDDVATMRPSPAQHLQILQSVGAMSTMRDVEHIRSKVLLVLSSQPDPIQGIDIDLHAQLRGRREIEARLESHQTVQVEWIATGHNIPLLKPETLARQIRDFAD